MIRFIIFSWIGLIDAHYQLVQLYSEGKSCQPLSSGQCFFCEHSNLNFEFQRKVNHRPMNEFHVVSFCIACKKIAADTQLSSLVCCSAVKMTRFVWLHHAEDSSLKCGPQWPLSKSKSVRVQQIFSKVHLFRIAMNMLSLNR